MLSSSGSWLPVTAVHLLLQFILPLLLPVKYCIWLDLDGILIIGMDLILARLLDPVTGTDTNVPLSKDLFCAGQISYLTEIYF